MISYNEALKLVLAQGQPLPPQTVDAVGSLGKVCAEDVLSPATLPPFRNSAMDGFAVNSSTLEQASVDNPITLKVTGSTAAGEQPQDGETGAWEIMTGAAVPDAFDAVIPVEQSRVSQRDDDNNPLAVAFSEPTKTMQHIRDAGEDFSPKDSVLTRGDTIQPQHIMALAALGIAKIQVRPTPYVSVISTGKELVDDPSKPLKPGQIRNSNAPYLQAALTHMGAHSGYGGTIHDDPQDFERTLKSLLSQGSNVVISTGAVSAGRYDFVPTSLRRLGADILFHKVRMRPGKPILFARFPDGAYYFGLPGNPISCAVGLRFFVYPLLRQLQGRPPETFKQAILANSVKKKPNMRFFLKACAYQEENTQRITVLPGQESFKIQPLLQANCWAVLPDEEQVLESGSTIVLASLYPDCESTTPTLNPAPAETTN